MTCEYPAASDWRGEQFRPVQCCPEKLVCSALITNERCCCWHHVGPPFASLYALRAEPRFPLGLNANHVPHHMPFDNTRP